MKLRNKRSQGRDTSAIRRTLSIAAVLMGIIAATTACSVSDAPERTAGADSDAGTENGSETGQDGTATTAVASGECDGEGGILRVGHVPFTSVWDLHASSQGEVVEFSAPAFNGLVARDPDDPAGLEVVPDLAHEWEVSEDGLTYTFRLREGVKWHDGEDFTSADVTASFDKIMSPPENVPSPRAELFNSVDNVEAPDDYTIVFNMVAPDGGFMELLSMPWNVIYPAHILEEAGVDAYMNPGIENRIGTGPFRYTDFDVNTHLSLEANPDYFKDGLPCLDGIEFRVFQDSTATTTALIGDQLDVYRSFAGVLEPDNAAIMESRSENITVGTVSPMHLFMSLYMNTETAPYDDIRVRQAISEAIDRQAIADSVQQGATVGGLVLPGSEWELPPDELEAMPGYGPDMEARRERARELLAEAGFTEDDPVEISITTRPGFDSLDTATRIQPMLEAIGAEVTINPVDRARQGEMRADGTFGLTVNFLPLLGVDPTYLFGTFLVSDLASNQSRTSVPELDELWQSQATMTDPSERADAVDEMHKGYLEHSSLLVLSWVDGMTAWRDNVEGFFPAPQTGTWDSRHEGTWLAD